MEETTKTWKWYQSIDDNDLINRQADVNTGIYNLQHSGRRTRRPKYFLYSVQPTFEGEMYPTTITGSDQLPQPTGTATTDQAPMTLATQQWWKVDYTVTKDY